MYDDGDFAPAGTYAQPKVEPHAGAPRIERSLIVELSASI